MYQSSPIIPIWQICQNPYQPLQYLGSWFGLNITPAEVAFLNRNRGIASHIWSAHRKAVDAAIAIFGPGFHSDNDPDAFRHCLGAALLTRDLGPSLVGVAKEFLDLHEEGRPRFEKIMDSHNNDVGMEIAQEFPPYGFSWSDEQLKSMCVAKLYNGFLIRNLAEAREKEAARPKWWEIWSWWSSWSWSRR